MRNLLMAMFLMCFTACAVEPVQEDVESSNDDLYALNVEGFSSTLKGNTFEKQIQINAFLSQAQTSHKISTYNLKKLYLSLAFQHLCPAVPTPVGGSWGVSDQAGNTNTQGAATACRAGIVQSLMTNGKLYELSHVFDESSPHSLFAANPLVITPNPTFCLDTSNFAYDTNFCGHSESLSGEFGSEGTQLDFFGHAGLRLTPSTPSAQTVFYNGFVATDVFAGALSGQHIKPLNTIGILLDAKKHNGGIALGPDDVVTKQDVLDMIAAQDLDWLGIQPGMAVFIYTGKGDTWGIDPTYYLAGPGLRVEVVEDLYKPNHVVYHGLDNPFTDHANFFTFQFLSGNDPLDPFPVHTRSLRAGILQSQNLNLTQMANDKVYLFALQLAPPQIAKTKGAMVTPQAFGAPWN